MDQMVNPCVRIATLHQPTYWQPFLVKSQTWKSALEQSLGGPQDPLGRREVMLKHPDAESDACGLAPSIEVKFGCLQIGEKTDSSRTNASQFYMLLEGDGHIDIAETSFEIAPRDTWIVPAMNAYRLSNKGNTVLRYITYSNAALLKLMHVYLEEPFSNTQKTETSKDTGMRARDAAGPGHVLNDTGAKILPYEYLVDPDSLASTPLIWRWKEVEPHLPQFHRMEADYNGRPLWALYNPATERRIGTTSCFFATISSSPPNRSGMSHKHASAAINFVLEGQGHSLVGGYRMNWEAGDIMLSAPGWVPHAHYIGDQATMILTVQDHPLHISMESLIWQENLPDGPIMNIGTGSGFNTNLVQKKATL
jgi:gentisate 1,2-dioxygenase